MEAMERLSSHLENRRPELKRMKEQGALIVAYSPNAYMPEELIFAAGAIPLALNRGGDSDAVQASAPYLMRYLDAFCRAQIGYRVLGKETLYQLPELLVVPVTDLNVRGIADSWEFFTEVEVFRLGVPHLKTGHGFQHFLDGLNLLKERLEERTGRKITEQRLHEEIVASNRLRDLFRKTSLLRKSEDPPIRGKDFIALSQASLYADRQTMIDILQSLSTDGKGKKMAGSKGPRILVTGSTLAQGDDKVVDLLEEAGASIVVEEFCEGLRDYWDPISEDGDPLRALADGYFMRRVPAAFFRGATQERIDFLSRLIADFRVDGVVWYSLLYRETYGIEAYLFQRAADKMDLPVLNIASDYDASETGALRTRIETFVETLKRR
jgi:benzoyl-CoA reductase/2-hydroxyglutaryl-CoA dehydratase subunit BcrC/BadD/HgdB